MSALVEKPRYASTTVVGTFDLFRDLTPKDLACIAPLMLLRRYDVGNYIITTAESGTEVFFLISGTVRVCAFSANGKQVHFEDLEAGSLFGEISAIDNGERSGDCIALGEVTLSVMSRDDFLLIVQQYPTVLNALLCRLTGMIRRQMKRVFEFTSCSVSQRIRFEVLRLAADIEKYSERTSKPVQILSPPTHAELATRISTNREAVTRELKRLEALGIIEWRPGAHFILDMEALVDLASNDVRKTRS